MEFYTVDSKLMFDKNFLIIKKIKHDPSKRYWFDSFILIGLLIAFQIDKAINDKPWAWVMVIAAIAWIFPHSEKFFKILFINKWGNRIRVNEITKIDILPVINELETTLRIKFNSGRQNLFVFRTAERQVEGFIEFLQQQPQIQFSTSDGNS